MLAWDGSDPIDLKCELLQDTPSKTKIKQECFYMTAPLQPIEYEQRSNTISSHLTIR
ncbi:hypothetical protein [Brevibacillus laterosporus]|uniref:hypothetical protein n=1 Tax=Brevibacillus laterosporus TaxID=1465 RepID=UPI0013156816|nr:hypothetical protein [Brevibacillus laterosporus]